MMSVCKSDCEATFSRASSNGEVAPKNEPGCLIPSIGGPATFDSRKDPLMTSDPSQRSVSPLRARMIEDMTVRGFKEDTRRD